MECTDNIVNSGVTIPFRSSRNAFSSNSGRGRGRGRGSGRGRGRGEGGRRIISENKESEEPNKSAAKEEPRHKHSRRDLKGGRPWRSRKTLKNNKSEESTAGGRGRRGSRKGRGGRTVRGKGRGGIGERGSLPQHDAVELKNTADNTMQESSAEHSNVHCLRYDRDSMSGFTAQAVSPFIAAPVPATRSSTPIPNHHSTVLSGVGGVVASHPQIFMTRLNTHLSLDGLNGDNCDVMLSGGGEDHIAEQLAAGLLFDDGDDGIELAVEGYSGKMDQLGEEKKVSVEDEVTERLLAGDESTSPKRLQLVTLPAGFSVGVGGHVFTLDEAQRQEKQQHENHVEGQPGDDDGDDKWGSKMMKKKIPATPKKKRVKDSSRGLEKVEAASNTVSDVIQKLKAKEVSISELTKVHVKQSESAQLLSSLSKKNCIKNGSIRATVRSEKEKITGSEEVRKRRKGKKSKTKFANDDAANLRAARHFNRSVRACVERSDPDGMREILRDKHNHRFALDSHVLETVMKAYVMAAMFEDALYCLRNCTLPSTLNAIQMERILLCLPQNLRNSSAYTAADMINALCIATDFDRPTFRTYFMRIARGIALEFLEEATSARDRICSAPCERLVRSAHCVVDARFRRGKKPTDLIVDPGHQLGVFIPDTHENRGMQAGDAVSILPYAGPYPMSAESLDRNMIEATVTNAQPLVLRLQDKGNSDLYQMLIEPVEGNVYRIDKLANRMGFNRQLAAVVSVASSLEEDEVSHYVTDKRHPSPELVKAVTAMDENIDPVMLAGGKFNPRRRGNDLTSTAAICSQAIPWSLFGDSVADAESWVCDNSDQEAIRQESLLALQKYGVLQGLNASQRLAVQGAVSNRLTLVQGPPGTGKTAVAIRILQHWAQLALVRVKPGESPSPILATSDSNIAVDNLVEGCANVGLRVVRLGRPEAIRPELLPYCIDRPSDRGGSISSSLNYGGISASLFKEKMKILKNAQVVCCTCIGSGGDILDSMTFERVMVDEATQATEPAVLVPLSRGCRQLVLVGDHCQLPPTVLSTRAEEEGLGVPLFSRMVACGIPPFMLDTQYRMHPGISMFPSDLFYGGKLNDGVSPPERRPLQGFPWPREEFPIAFIPVIDSIEIDDGVSKANEEEASEVCNAVVHLLNGGQCTVSDIAVVTPYAAQVRLIRRHLRDMLPKGPPFVEVSSTDGFQGREKEAVIFSAVRSNSYGAVGFVSDWRRINVSFTRARRALIVVGNPDTLRRGDPDTLGAWLQWADAQGVNMMSPGKPRGRYEPEVLRKVRGGTTAAEMLKDVLDRQQAQLKSAEQQQARAVMNAAGHVMGNENADNYPQALKDDLAMLENVDGCWDDSDFDDDLSIPHNSSHVHITASGISGIDESHDRPLDAWDL